MQFAGDARFRLLTVRLPIRGLSPKLDGFRVWYVTDIHIRVAWEPVFDSMLDAFDAAKPDLVLFGGDLVENKRNHRPSLPTSRKLIERLDAGCPFGVIGVTGNHDGQDLHRNLTGAPITWATDRRVMVGPHDARCEVVGLAGPRKVYSTSTVGGCPPKQPGVPRFVLSHYPFIAARAAVELGADLALSGHTHGGQACLGFGVPLVTHDKLPRRYSAGLHAYPHRNPITRLLVSRGLGMSHWQFRAFCPPEVHLIELVRVP